MDCEAAEPLIEALCDDELDVATAARLVAHLDLCASCDALRRSAETRSSALRAARPVDRLPDEVRSRLLRAVASASRGRRVRRGKALAAGTALAGVVAAILAFALLRARGPASGPPAFGERPVVRELSGEVFCLRCALARLFPDMPLLDPRHLPVLRTDDGEIVTLLDGAVTGAVLSRKGCAGRRVVLAVRLFPRQEVAEVLSARELGPGAESPPGEVVAAPLRTRLEPPR